MKTNRSFLISFTLFLILVLAACNLPGDSGPDPRVWIDNPLGGADPYPLELLVIQSHASSGNGIASAALQVNGIQVRIDDAADPTDPLASFAQSWDPPSSGEYTIVVLATDRYGNTGTSNRIKITIAANTLPLCTPKQLSAPVQLEPVDWADVSTRVHFSWSYSGPCFNCHPSSYGIRISEPGSSVLPDVGLGWGFITYDEHTTSRDWNLPAGQCYLWQVLAYVSDSYGPPSPVWHFCIPDPSITTTATFEGLPIYQAPPTVTHLAPTATSTPTLTPTLSPTTPPPTDIIKFIISNKICSFNSYVVLLQWNDSQYELGYRVFRDKVLIATLPANSFSYEDISPDYGQHFYYIEAFGNGGIKGSEILESSGCVY